MNRRRRTILVIDHDHLTLRVLTAILQNHGLHVIPTHRPDAEMDLTHIDVVLCSYDMPYMMANIVGSLRARKPELAIYMSSVTAYNELAVKVRDRIDGYLHRPLRMENLNTLVEDLKSRLQNDLGAAEAA